MTRIVAGAAGGRTLRVPPAGTRPTSDRVREALFSRLEHLDVLDGARVLDLYAGSGALGLEAASRGAADVVLVESARPAAEVCRANAASLGLEAVQVVGGRVLPFLQRRTDAPVDLALLDPPYDLSEAELSAVLEALAPLLSPHAVVVVERSVRSPEPGWPAGDAPAGLERTESKRYGETVLWFASPTFDRAAGEPAERPVGPAGPSPRVAP